MAEIAWSLLCVVRNAFGAETAEGDPLHSRDWTLDSEKSFIKQERKVEVATS